MKSHKLEVILVNLISFDYLVRYQAPLPVNTLAGYLKINTTDVEVTVVDMQKVFDELSSAGKSGEDNFNSAVAYTIEKIRSSSQNAPVIVGLSMKWATQEVATAIISSISPATSNNQVLFVIGNIMATYGYQHLLETPEFKNAIAVVGEGEDALVSIVKKALENLDDITNLSVYRDIANVATNTNGKTSVNNLARLNLAEYPNSTVPSAYDLFDKEWRVYAIETSRGCPWGMCTFCSIRKQFGDCCIDPSKKADWKWKGFPLDKTFADIQNYIGQGALAFDIKDSEFFGPTREDGGSDPFYDSMNRVEQFATQFSELNKKFGITLSHISARTDTVVRENEPLKNARRRQVYELLAKSGLIGLYLGVESGSKKQLKRFGKGVTVEENRMAIKILRGLGLKLEVGFIFFDPLADMEDLYDNINFIGEFSLYRTDSRIFGSLRVQEGTAYVKMLEKRGLLGKHRKESLSYSGHYQDDEVFFIKATFDKWERATVKLVRLLPLSVRLQYYEMDFLFLRDILRSYSSTGQNGVRKTVVDCAKRRKNFLNTIWDTGGLLNRYLAQAKIANDALTLESSP